MNLENINPSELSDGDVILHMRKFNYEKFKTLVRMHLSFELDLNTDEFDLPCHEIVYEEKGKLKKWNRMSKKQRHLSGGGCAASGKCSVSAENSPIEVFSQQIDSGFLFHLSELKHFLLMAKNVTQEGIFRKTGSISRQNELRLHIQKEEPLKLEDGDYSAHDCATVFKGYLAEMAEPLLTDAHYPAHLQIAPLCLRTPLNVSSNSSLLRPERVKREQHLLNSVQLLLLLLPEENRQLLEHVIEILHSVMQHEDLNKMSPDNLATLFAPHLICPRNLPPEALHYLSKKLSSIIAYMISKGSIIFDVPAKLATDIRAYIMERKRKKTMSPEQTLDDSLSDISTVNTVYTFVDREKTAAAHTANTTDTELAQLYAHIQTLPESSKKRRLIKQFNKQNGQGTPLQLVVMNRLKSSETVRSSKSISDSIKKHIFHKSIMSRTPKRANAPTPIGVQTPNLSNVKNPKLRVLFQSPAPEGMRNITDITSSSTSLAHTTSNTYTAIKSHTLQKSISSFVLNSPSLNRATFESNESSSPCSSDGLVQHHSAAKSGCSVSAPVSRQSSSDFGEHPTSNADIMRSGKSKLATSDCCATPLKINSDGKLHAVFCSAVDKKTVAWDENNLLEIGDTSNPCTPVTQNSGDLRSRFKSEPNLNRILKDKIDVPLTVHEVNCLAKSGKSLTQKLMKGVSMSNIKFPFTAQESTKRLVRSVSSTLKRHTGDEHHGDLHTDANFMIASNTSVTPLLEDVDDEDLDDDTFEDSPDDQLDSYSSTENQEIEAEQVAPDCCSNELSSCSRNSHQQLLLQHSNIYRNIDLITSTPSLLIGKRRSMSPITKSTQRMPKSMQESIMTPRSRKPVIVVTNAVGGSDQNQTICQSDILSFREQDEENSFASTAESKNIANVLGAHSDPLSNTSSKQQQLLINSAVVLEDTNLPKNEDEKSGDMESDNALTSNFKEYLLGRSVLTTSPADLSFSSQPDDFNSTQEIDDINESQLSKSLLYCLDGHQPDEIRTGISNTKASLNDSTIIKCPQPCQLLENSYNNVRKRAASSELGQTAVSVMDDVRLANKENCDSIDNFILSKKLLIKEQPGETSF